MSAAQITVNPLGLVLIAWVVWYFWIFRKEGVRVTEAAGAQKAVIRG
ncbi:MAG: hypothetical protein BMS9Abin28_1498 [Anaerolineae bacterium]|nr:MAG: hypothetical protein BMS9Abin28_1498 [Anaerolineae bacterium]